MKDIIIKISKQISVEIVPEIGVYILDTVQDKEMAIVPSELEGLSLAILRALEVFKKNA